MRFDWKGERKFTHNFIPNRHIILSFLLTNLQFKNCQPNSHHACGEFFFIFWYFPFMSTILKRKCNNESEIRTIEMFFNPPRITECWMMILNMKILMEKHFDIVTIERCGLWREEKSFSFRSLFSVALYLLLCIWKI